MGNSEHLGKKVLTDMEAPNHPGLPPDPRDKAVEADQASVPPPPRAR